MSNSYEAIRVREELAESTCPRAFGPVRAATVATPTNAIAKAFAEIGSNSLISDALAASATIETGWFAKAVAPIGGNSSLISDALAASATTETGRFVKAFSDIGSSKSLISDALAASATIKTGQLAKAFADIGSSKSLISDALAASAAVKTSRIAESFADINRALLSSAVQSLEFELLEFPTSPIAPSPRIDEALPTDRLRVVRMIHLLRTGGFEDSAHRLARANDLLTSSPDPRDMPHALHLIAGAVEEVARQLAGMPTKTLGDVLKTWKKRPESTPEEWGHLERIWILRCRTPGAGHGAGRMEAIEVKETMNTATHCLEWLLWFHGFTD